ncbi:MAG: 3-deoxy-D-manno-octulosonic acid transferase [Gammaproteobacteria bacterium]|tara:strand:+ start:35279 stop:36523 length:1245 start_codon:yes stop_codon:yes gene_type:complete
MRLFLYNSFLFILLPFIAIRLIFKSTQDKDYIKNFLNRLGFYKEKSRANLIWFHAVSLGEVIGSQVIIKKILENNNIIISVSTPTGLRQAKKIYGDQVLVVYAPWDFIFFIKNFINRFKPKALILFETEIWPSMIHEMWKNKLPIVLSNARLSEPSFKKYKLVKPLIGDTFNKISLVLAQSSEHVERFKSIGIDLENIVKVGSAKFDFDGADHSDSFKVGNHYNYILGASTHKGEDQIIVDAYTKLKKEFQDLKLILVPRHPERAYSILKILHDNKIDSHISSNLKFKETIDVIVINKTGLLNQLYEKAKVSFIGGSLLEKYGGHNIIEPALNKSPFIVGPYMKNFDDVLNLFIEKNACIQLKNSEKLFDAFKKLLNNNELRSHMIHNAYDVINENKGSSNKQYTHIQNLITQL